MIIYRSESNNDDEGEIEFDDVPKDIMEEEYGDLMLYLKMKASKFRYDLKNYSEFPPPLSRIIHIPVRDRKSSKPDESKLPLTAGLNNSANFFSKLRLINGFSQEGVPEKEDAMSPTSNGAPMASENMTEHFQDRELEG
ncbi:hypothetical protein TNCV_536371 [Trichonephila clavipes]|nr:hypothetical protein TNCV_536371 [Trichonephila clavipes]